MVNNKVKIWFRDDSEHLAATSLLPYHTYFELEDGDTEADGIVCFLKTWFGKDSGVFWPKYNPWVSIMMKQCIPSAPKIEFVTKISSICAYGVWTDLHGPLPIGFTLIEAKCGARFYWREVDRRKEK